jgi:hypothetical protein
VQESNRHIAARTNSDPIDPRHPHLVEAILPLHHHPQVLVVEDHNLDWQVLHLDCRQLLHVHDEAAVAVDIDNKSVGAGGDRPQSGGQPKAHGSEPPGGNPSPGLIILVPLGGPHLVLADSGADDGVAARELVQGRNGMLGHDEVVRNGELAGG